MAAYREFSIGPVGEGNMIKLLLPLVMAILATPALANQITGPPEALDPTVID
jgi:hypothetical protein